MLFPGCFTTSEAITTGLRLQVLELPPRVSCIFCKILVTCLLFRREYPTPNEIFCRNTTTHHGILFLIFLWNWHGEQTRAGPGVWDEWLRGKTKQFLGQNLLVLGPIWVKEAHPSGHRGTTANSPWVELHWVQYQTPRQEMACLKNSKHRLFLFAQTKFYNP